MVDPPRLPRKLSATDPAPKDDSPASSSAEGKSKKLVSSAPSRPLTAMTRDFPSPRPLHNFTLPPLRWGSQKYMMCVKDSDRSESSSSSSSVHRRSVKLALNRKRLSAEEDGDRIDLVEEKTRAEFDKVKEEFLKEREMEVEKTPQGMKRAASKVAEARPWNLRTRRAGCNAPAAKNGSPLSAAVERMASFGNQKETEKFAVALKSNEIKDDFWMLTGNPSPRRPKKRPRTLQRQLDVLSPGLCLMEITADRYKVAEVPDNNAKRERPRHHSMKVPP